MYSAFCPFLSSCLSANTALYSSLSSPDQFTFLPISFLPCLPACLSGYNLQNISPLHHPVLPAYLPASLQPTHITTELLPLPLQHPCSSTTVRGLHPQFFPAITVCLLLLYSNFYIIFCIFCYHSLWLGGARFFFYALGLPCFFRAPRGICNWRARAWVNCFPSIFHTQKGSKV